MFSGDGSRLTLWDLTSDAPPHNLKVDAPDSGPDAITDGAAVTSLVFLAEDMWFAALSDDGTVGIWEPDSGALVQMFSTERDGHQQSEIIRRG